MPTDDPDDARRRLDQEMKAQVRKKGLHWNEVAERAGMSYENLRRIRKGNQFIPADTQRALEAAFYWPTGFIEAILRGEEPPADEEDDRPRPPRLEDMSSRELIKYLSKRLTVVRQGIFDSLEPDEAEATWDQYVASVMRELLRRDRGDGVDGRAS